MATKPALPFDLVIRHRQISPLPAYAEFPKHSREALDRSLKGMDEGARALCVRATASFYEVATARIALSALGRMVTDGLANRPENKRFVREARRFLTAFDHGNLWQERLEVLALGSSGPPGQPHLATEDVLDPERIAEVLAELKSIVDQQRPAQPRPLGRKPGLDLSALADEFCQIWVSLTGTIPTWNERNNCGIFDYNEVCSSLFDVEYELKFSSEFHEGRAEDPPMMAASATFSAHRPRVGMALRNAVRRLGAAN